MDPDVFRAASSSAVEGRQNRMDRKMFEAAFFGDSSFFENLAESNSSNLLRVTIEKNTVLHVALQFKNFEAAKKIVNFSPLLVNQTNSKGNTPLHVAARVGDIEMVKLLIDQTKNQRDIEKGHQQPLLRKVNQDGDTALHVALRYDNDGRFEIVKELIKGDPELAKDLNNAGESALFLAVDRELYDIASHILSKAPTCSNAGRHGMNVLHALVLHTSCYINKNKLLSLSEMDNDRQVSAFYRVLITIVWVFSILLFRYRFREDVMYKAKVKNRKLRRTFGDIKEDFVKAVINNWPTAIEQRDNSGWTPLHIAAHLGNEKFVKLLLEEGNEKFAYVRNKEDLSALHIAAMEGNVEVMKELITTCPDIYEMLDNRGRTALHVAAETGQEAVVDYFLKGPSKKKAIKYFQKIVKFFEGGKIIVKFIQKVESSSKGENSSKAKIEGAEFQKLFEGLINEQDGEGNTPMHLAAIEGHYDLTSELEDSASQCGGVDLDATNKKGFTIMDNLLPRMMLKSWITSLFWSKGARPSLSGVLIRTGIQKSDQKPEQAGECSDSIQKSDQKPEQAGECSDSIQKSDQKSERAGDDGNGIRDSKETSGSDFGKQVGEINLLVATLITTVTFAAAFTVPGGYKSEGVDEGLAILCKRFAFGVFLIANTLAFGLSTTSVFIHFFATTTITSAAFHREVAQHTPLFTKWSIGALLAAFIAGTYIVVPLSLGITIAVILFCCFLISLFFPIAIK